MKSIPVRKHLSNIKGGQLIRHCNGASVFSFMISDVPFDDIEVIASGPTVADKSTYQDAYSVLEKYHLTELIPENISVSPKKGMEVRLLKLQNLEIRFLTVRITKSLGQIKSR